MSSGAGRVEDEARYAGLAAFAEDAETASSRAPYAHFDHSFASAPSLLPPLMPSDPRTLLPLKPADLVLLLALSEEERHGYALAREIAERTDGLITLEPGNLYRIIRRMEEEGLLAPSARRPSGAGDDERRRYYRLTPLGAQVAALEVQRLRTLITSKAARALPAMGATP